MEHVFVGKNNEEEEKISPYWAGRQKQEERDEMIKQAIDTDRVWTVELMVGYLDMPPTPSSRRIVETRLQRLVQGKYVRQIREGYVTYYVSPLVIKKGNPQYGHKLMETYTWLALERVFDVRYALKSDALRKLGGSLIADGAFAETRQGYTLEIDTGLDDINEYTSKTERYLRQADRLIETYPDWLGNVDNLRVLIVTKRVRRVAAILDKIREVKKSGMFLVTSQEQFQPFDESILGPIWSWTKDNELQALRRDAHATERA
jgi:hypothetical protein